MHVERPAVTLWRLNRDPFERVEPDPRWTPPKGPTPMWAKFKAGFLAVCHFAAKAFVVVLGYALAIGAELWHLAAEYAFPAILDGVVYIVRKIQESTKSAGSPLDDVNVNDVKRAAVAASLAPSAIGIFMSILIIALHGFAALVSALPLGLLGTVLLFVAHFAILIAVRANHGHDPLAGIADTV